MLLHTHALKLIQNTGWWKSGCRTRVVLSSRHFESNNSLLSEARDSHENPNVFWGWVDADWAGDTDTRRSHTGYVLMMNSGPISWERRRSDNVSLSTSKAEFVAASQVG